MKRVTVSRVVAPGGRAAYYVRGLEPGVSAPEEQRPKRSYP